MKKIVFEKDSTLSICLDTIKIGKQALVFCSSKRNAESVAEKLSKILKGAPSSKLVSLSSSVKNVLSSPTKQCLRLSSIVEKGVAFHHAGLASGQRELIEDAFREGVISVICSTPTLAAGLDLPAFRAIIKDMKRFGPRGMMPIPVLEYEQMSGRAGRPGQEDYGESIIVGTDNLDYYFDNYINGTVEEIYSKLAVEPVLRMYVLSLIASSKIKNFEELYSFFDSTFYAFQFGDVEVLHSKLDMTVERLKNWKMLEGDSELGFVSGDEFGSSGDLKATLLGLRVSQIYLDPLTAHVLLIQLRKLKTFSQLIHLLCCSLELRPLLNVKSSEFDKYYLEQMDVLINEDEFVKFSTDDYVQTLKTTRCFLDWCDEKSEDWLFDTYGIRPGELNAKLNILDWLLYACSELLRLDGKHDLLKIVSKARVRLKEGVKEELLPLLHFKGVGRVRARRLFDNDIRSIVDMTSVSNEKLIDLVGKLAVSLKKQVGIDIEEVREEKKKNSQISLDEFI